jgi:hypothetical protein
MHLPLPSCKAPFSIFSTDHAIDHDAEFGDLLLVLGASFYFFRSYRARSGPPATQEWEQLTNFPDSAVFSCSVAGRADAGVSSRSEHLHH